MSLELDHYSLVNQANPIKSLGYMDVLYHHWGVVPKTYSKPRVAWERGYILKKEMVRF